MELDPINVGGMFATVIAAMAAYASQRAASRASTLNSNATQRVEMEKDAYNRARQFDTDTITRQERHIEQLMETITELRLLVKRLRLRLLKYEPNFDLDEDGNPDE